MDCTTDHITDHHGPPQTTTDHHGPNHRPPQTEPQTTILAVPHVRTPFCHDSFRWTNDARDDGESHELPVIDVHSTPLSKDATLYVLVYDAKSLSQARKGAGKNGQEDLRLQCEGE